VLFLDEATEWSALAVAGVQVALRDGRVDR
jgi:hypothetical protein